MDMDVTVSSFLFFIPQKDKTERKGGDCSYIIQKKGGSEGFWIVVCPHRFKAQQFSFRWCCRSLLLSPEKSGILKGNSPLGIRSE